MKTKEANAESGSCRKCWSRRASISGLIEGDVGAAAAQEAGEGRWRRKRLPRGSAMLVFLAAFSLIACRSPAQCPCRHGSARRTLRISLRFELEWIRGNVTRLRGVHRPVASGDIVGFLAWAAGGRKAVPASITASISSGGSPKSVSVPVSLEVHSFEVGDHPRWWRPGGRDWMRRHCGLGAGERDDSQRAFPERTRTCGYRRRGRGSRDCVRTS